MSSSVYRIRSNPRSDKFKMKPFFFSPCLQKNRFPSALSRNHKPEMPNAVPSGMTGATRIAAIIPPRSRVRPALRHLPAGDGCGPNEDCRQRSVENDGRHSSEHPDARLTAVACFVGEANSEGNEHAGADHRQQQESKPQDRREYSAKPMPTTLLCSMAVIQVLVTRRRPAYGIRVGINTRTFGLMAKSRLTV